MLYEVFLTFAVEANIRSIVQTTVIQNRQTAKLTPFCTPTCSKTLLSFLSGPLYLKIRRLVSINGTSCSQERRVMDTPDNVASSM